jgi:hypothetical protein
VLMCAIVSLMSVAVTTLKIHNSTKTHWPHVGNKDALLQ